MKHPRLSVLLTAATAAAALAVLPAPNASASGAQQPPGHGGQPAGAVFVQTDDLTHNAVIAYDRAADGHLTKTGTYATGGAGAAVAGAVVDPLASQGSLTLDPRHDLLFAVNGGSDTVTVFGVDGSRLVRRQILSTHGDLPVSVGIAGDLVYVLNARGGGSITGFRVSGRHVEPVPGSTRTLNLTPNSNPEFLQTPSQVAITPDGRSVVVATKTHGTLIVFPLSEHGRPAASPVVTASGTVPFALTFDRARHLLVVDATGFASSYTVKSNGSLTLLSQVGPTGQAAACWTVFVRGTLYAANAGSNSITAFTDHRGQLSIGDATAAATGAGPVDIAASRNGRFIYQLAGGSGQVDEYRRGADGTLTKIGTVDTGLGAASGHPLEGIAAS
ncbi:MAG: lactonase family protein [Propionicimonas sp.]